MTSRTYHEFAVSIIETLESLGLQYAISSSFASITYGEARTTMDIDIMGRSQKHLHDISAILVVHGTTLDYDYIARWAQEIGATQLWNQLLAEYRRTSS